MLDIVRTIQGILDAAHGHPVLIAVNKDRSAISWRRTDMPHHVWEITVDTRPLTLEDNPRGELLRILETYLR